MAALQGLTVYATVAHPLQHRAHAGRSRMLLRPEDTLDPAVVETFSRW